MIDLRNLITSSPNHIEVSKAEVEDYGPEDLDDNDMVTNMLPHNLGSRNDELPLSPIKTGRNEFFGDGQEQEQLHNLSQEIQEPSETVPKFKSIDLSQESLDVIDLETLIQLFRYRIKNNSLGQIHYFPSEWNGKLYCKIRLQVQEAQPHLFAAVPRRKGAVRALSDAADPDALPDAHRSGITALPRSSRSERQIHAGVRTLSGLARRVRRNSTSR